MANPTEEREFIRRLIADSGISQDLISRSTDAELAPVMTVIADTADHLPSEEQGGVRTIFAGRSVSVGEVGWKLLTSMTAFGISMLDPTHLTTVIALKEGLDLLKELRPLLKKLDVAEMIVCTAIMNVTTEKKHKTLMVGPPGANKVEIESYFAARGEMTPVGLDDILKELLQDKVIVAQHDPLAGSFYSIEF
jgi:hypothetical protein